MKLASRNTYYHGTSSKNLRKILKEGLVADAKNKVFDSEQSSSGSATIKTFGGVYLTRDWMYAYSSATTATQKYGGDRVIVEVTLEERHPDIIADEDSVILLLKRALGSSLVEMREKLSRRSELREVYNAILNLPLDEEVVIEAVEKSDFSMLTADLVNSYIPKINRVFERASTKYLAELSHLFEKALKTYVFHLIRQARKLEGFNLGSWEKLKDAVDKLSLKLKGHWEEENDPFITLRSKGGIGFSGSNRIISILQIKEDLGMTEEEPELTTVYGNTVFQEQLFEQKISKRFKKASAYTREQKLMGKIDDAFHNLIIEMRKEDKHDPDSKVIEYLQGRIHRILKKHFGKSPNDKYYQDVKNG